MSIKLEQGITKGFVTRTGFKQGDNLSPLLYNLFANRLPSVFNDECDGVMVNNMTVNCLSWADDCVLISQSSTGLQRLIDKTSLAQLKNGFEQVLIDEKKGSDQLKPGLRIVFILKEG